MKHLHELTPEHQAKAREIADKHGAAIVAAMLQADQETHLVNALEMLRNELATLIAKADERELAIQNKALLAAGNELAKCALNIGHTSVGVTSVILRTEQALTNWQNLTKQNKQ